MKRVPNWRSALDAAVDAHRGVPFTWGRHDCSLFAADCVLAMTGEDPAARFRGRYKTPKGAAGALKRAGFASQVNVVAAHFSEIHSSRAGVGDIAIVPKGELMSLGIVIGPEIAVLTLAGLGVVPLTRASRAFKVG